MPSAEMMQLKQYEKQNLVQNFDINPIRIFGRAKTKVKCSLGNLMSLEMLKKV